jgi:hypothetical protein
MTDMLDAALRYAAAGLSVIPIDPRTKRPYFSLLPQVCNVPPLDDKDRTGRGIWKPFQQHAASEALVRHWFDRKAPVNIGIVCGAVSGGLLVLDFDADADRTYQLWRAKVGTAIADLLPTVRTGKGYHVYLRYANPGGNVNLAERQDDQQQSFVPLIQTRGEGGFVVAPPSRHPNGKRYEVLHGRLDAIPDLV